MSSMNVVGRVLTGALAGIAATAPMTVLMVLGHRSLFWWQRDPLPPRQITDRALQMVHAGDDLSEESKQALAIANHFGYGGSMGALFGSAIPIYGPSDAIAKGAAFGCGVWAASYLGWLPAAGMYRSATEEPQERNVVIIGSHLLWGACLGYAFSQLRNCCPGITDRNSTG
jgi:hypothetical protein